MYVCLHRLTSLKVRLPLSGCRSITPSWLTSQYTVTSPTVLVDLSTVSVATPFLSSGPSLSGSRI